MSNSTTKPSPIQDHELEEQYRNMLDEVHGTVKIAGYDYCTSQALEDIDPVAFRCGLVDYISAELDDRLVEVDGEYYERYEWEQYQSELEDAEASNE
jgi:hypothetical protein